MIRTIAAVALAALAAAPVAAQEDWRLDEVRAGVFYHSVYPGFIPVQADWWNFSRLENVKLAALFTYPENDLSQAIGSPRLEIGTTLNLWGRENLVHANLNWQIPVFDTPLYLELGLGVAVTDGALEGAARPARNFGCALNFYEAAGIGAHVSESFTLTLRYEHMSNLDICLPNEGLSNFGLMAGFKF